MPQIQGAFRNAPFAHGPANAPWYACQPCRTYGVLLGTALNILLLCTLTVARVTHHNLQPRNQALMVVTFSQPSTLLGALPIARHKTTLAPISALIHPFPIDNCGVQSLDQSSHQGAVPGHMHSLQLARSRWPLSPPRSTSQHLCCKS